jgi:hypothetical protein
MATQQGHWPGPGGCKTLEGRRSGFYAYGPRQKCGAIPGGDMGM